MFEHFGCTEAIVIDEEKSTGLGASDDADCDGAAGLDLGGEISA